MKKINIILFLLPETNLFDLGSVAQVINELNALTGNINMRICADGTTLKSSTGLEINHIKYYKTVLPETCDYIFVISSDIKYIKSKAFVVGQDVSKWFGHAYGSGAKIIAICNAAFFIGRIGLLDDKKCTTHWKRTAELQHMFPHAEVLDNVLFVEDKNIVTSAGSASGVDVALEVLAQEYDERVCQAIARELVVFKRRSGNQPQESVFLKYRNHVHKSIHVVQDYIDNNIEKKVSIRELASIAGMSERNFSRVFKNELHLTPVAYIHKIKKEKIKELIGSPDLSKRQIANAIGLVSEKQVSRIFNKK